MNVKHLAILACTVALCACGDEKGITAPNTAAHLPPVAPSRADIAGIVVRGYSDVALVFLQTPDAVIPLQGPAAGPMTSVVGADVRVRGTWDGHTGLIVENFTVLAVKGLPALDGILVATEDGLSLRLSDGTMHRLEAAPTELMGHIGARVWVTVSPDNSAVEFGVIQVIE